MRKSAPRTTEYRLAEPKRSIGQVKDPPQEYLVFEDAARLSGRAPIHLRGSSCERERLLRKYADRIQVGEKLTRSLVSFQGNKSAPCYRWLKFKEGFSEAFVRHVLEAYAPSVSRERRLLDPFAGSGTTVTCGAEQGWDAWGIELMPVGVAAARSRMLAHRAPVEKARQWLRKIKDAGLARFPKRRWRFPHLAITAGAFPPETEDGLARYQSFLQAMPDPDTRDLFWFASLCVLEDVSYTRKDGQYLRWDSRSPRDLQTAFNKGLIVPFDVAVARKAEEMLQDVESRRAAPCPPEKVHLIQGSCLAELPQMAENSFDMVVTSPPYCNRYDYTRTYALELAYMGYDDDAIKLLRQTLLSATVENRSKRQTLRREYEARHAMAMHDKAVKAFERQAALQEVLENLRAARDSGSLNNSNIPRLVENYFFEMSFVVHELGRVLAPGGRVVMVNDNVRYHGEEAPADLILAEFAESAGLTVDAILTLKRGKGNSSQQMGAHGRSELRKCVYVWSKPNAARA